MSSANGGFTRPTATTTIRIVAILGAVMAEEQQGPERHINIHFEPKHMAGKYANFANVSHSDYEFTLTFARVDHEIEDDEIPGVVVSRINLSPRFMRELLDAMEDNYSKWRPAPRPAGRAARGRRRGSGHARARGPRRAGSRRA